MNRFLQYSVFTFLILSSAYLWAQSSSTPSTGAVDFDRRAMLASIAEQVIMPCNEDFLLQAEQLAIALASLEADTLAPAREQWHATMQQWQRCNLFEVGDLRMMILHNKIAKYPLNPRIITGYLESDAMLNAAFVADTGSNSRGLFAIELLLFSDDVLIDDGLNNERKRALLAAYGADVHTQAAALISMWSSQGSDYLAKFIAADQAAGTTQGSINMLVNEMITSLALIVLDKLGAPMGLEQGEPRPERAQAYYSASSLEHIRSNLEAYRAVLIGSWQDEPQLALADYLDAMGASDETTGLMLSERLLQQLDSAFEALAAVKKPLREAVLDNPEDVDALYQAVRTLLVLTKVDMGNQMGVTVTFNDSDGD